MRGGRPFCLPNFPDNFLSHKGGCVRTASGSDRAKKSRSILEVLLGPVAPTPGRSDTKRLRRGHS